MQGLCTRPLSTAIRFTSPQISVLEVRVFVTFFVSAALSLDNQNKVLSFIYTTPCSFEIAFSLIISFDPLTQVGRQRQVLSELQLIHRVPLGQTDKDAPSSGFRGRWWWQSLARLDVSFHFPSADPVVWCTTCPTIHSSPGYYLHFWWKKN